MNTAHPGLAPLQSNAIANDRKTARIVGILFLMAFVAYGGGSGLVNAFVNTPDRLAGITAQEEGFAVGAVVMMVNSAIVIGIGLLMLPVLKRANPKVAYGYLLTRTSEGLLLIVGVIALLSLVTLGRAAAAADAFESALFQVLGDLAVQSNLYAYHTAMAVLAFGSLFFCRLIYQMRLVPRALAVLGFVGYSILLGVSVLEIVGVGVGLFPLIPAGLFEVFFGTWLIAKGFAPTPATPTEPRTNDPTMTI